MDHTAEYKTWPVNEYGYHVAPEGLDWIESGAQIGSGARIGSGAWIGSGARIESDAQIGSGAWIGSGAQIESDAQIVSGAWITDDAVVQNEPGQQVIPLGRTHRYRKTMYVRDGVAIINSGCHDFTLQQALDYWREKKSRKLTYALLQGAKAIADVKGWKYE